MVSRLNLVKLRAPPITPPAHLKKKKKRPREHLPAENATLF